MLDAFYCILLNLSLNKHVECIDINLNIVIFIHESHV